jgi:hypothetical protein
VPGLPMKSGLMPCCRKVRVAYVDPFWLARVGQFSLAAKPEFVLTCES